MDKPSIEIIGVYRVPFTQELYDEAFSIKWGGISIPFWRKGKIRKLLTEELSSIVLVEVHVRDRDESFDVADFHQPDSEQGPYSEGFLNPDGTEVISTWFDVPNTKDLRFTFFLHFFNPKQPLESSYGDLAFPELEEIPPRLKNLVQYEPVD